MYSQYKTGPCKLSKIVMSQSGSRSVDKNTGSLQYSKLNSVQESLFML